MSGMDNNSIKNNIYRFRKAKGYTQEEMASRLGTSVTTYRSIESGKTNLIHPMVHKIADVLEISEEDLFINTGSSEKKYVLEDGGIPYMARKPESDIVVRTTGNYETRLRQADAEIGSLKDLLKSKDAILKSKDAMISDLFAMVRILRSQNDSGDGE